MCCRPVLTGTLYEIFVVIGIAIVTQSAAVSLTLTM